MGQSRHPWKSRMMLLFAVLLLGVGIQAAPQHHHPKSSYHQPKSSYQAKCWYQPQEECRTVYDNVERKVSNVECHTEYGKKCHTEFKQKCGTEYTTECHKVPTKRLVKKTELKCTRDRYGKKTCKNQDKYVTVHDSERKCETKAHEKCNRVPQEVCENKPHEVCHNVLTKKTEKVPRKHCKTVQNKVCN